MKILANNYPIDFSVTIFIFNCSSLLEVCFVESKRKFFG